MSSSNWNPWRGCNKISEGCRHCYMHGIFNQHGNDPTVVTLNRDEEFYKPELKKRNNDYKWNPTTKIFVCSGSDFFHEKADKWRPKVWNIIKERQDIQFFTITKRIHRVIETGVMPDDWGDGYFNFQIISTCENQDRTDFRLPFLINLPCQNRGVILEPMLESINLIPYLETRKFTTVIVGGEAGRTARDLKYEWVLDIAKQCKRFDVKFKFGGSGSYWVDENGYRTYEPDVHEQYKVAAKYNNFKDLV